MRNRLAVVLDLVENSDDLKPLTNHRPIASLPFAGRYRIIDFVFSSLYNAQISSAALFIAGSGHSLYDHIRSGAVWGLDSPIGGGVFTHSQVEYKLGQQVSGEDSENESFDYYKNHRKYIKKSNAEHVLVTGTQVLASVNLDAALQYHKQKDTEVTGVFKKYKTDEILPETVLNQYIFEDGKTEYIKEILDIDEAALKQEKISVGLKMAIVKKPYLLEFLDFASGKNIQVNAENVMKYALERSDDVGGFEYTGYIKTIENIPSYFQANMDMLEEPNFSSLFFRNSPIITRPHHSSPTYYGVNSKVSNSQIASGSELYGTVNHSIVFRNVVIEENSTVESSIIMSHGRIGKNVTLDHVILDKDVVIEDGVKLVGTAEEPIVIKKSDVITNVTV